MLPVWRNPPGVPTLKCPSRTGFYGSRSEFTLGREFRIPSRGAGDDSTGSGFEVSSSQDRTPSDADLVVRSRGGDSLAFAELIRRYRRAAYLVSWGITGSHEDAEDAAQESFIVALERLDECREPDRFAGWFTTIVRNRAKNLLRRERVRVGEQITPRIASLEPGPERRTEQAFLRSRLQDALRGLPPVQREVVLLHDLEGWKHREIAERLGMPSGTVRSHLHFARKALRDRLDDLNPTAGEERTG
jgi:RNA polymerase sigma-70 factor, ECF subfamily